MPKLTCSVKLFNWCIKNANEYIKSKIRIYIMIEQFEENEQSRDVRTNNTKGRWVGDDRCGVWILWERVQPGQVNL